MADRQRSRASARAQVALRSALCVLMVAPGCSGELQQARAADAVGLVAETSLAPLPTSLRADDAVVTLGVDPTRAAALQAAFRARIAHWTTEAGRLTQGKASAANVHVAACVRELGRRGELVALRADAPQPPASNMKLVTTAAALISLGGGAAWVTPFEAAGPLQDGVLGGDLLVRAAGDPLYDSAGRGEIEERLREVARALRAAGLMRVQGDLVLDEGCFETPGPGPGWPDPSQHWAEYCALSGGFSANGGVLHALLRAGAVGAAAEIEVHPAPHGLRTSYDVRTLAGTSVDVRVGATRTTATVRGNLGQGIGVYEAEFAHPDPVELFGTLVWAALEHAGIALDGGIRRERELPRGAPLATLRSPLADCLEAINAESKNSVADQLFLSLGHALAGAGTRAGGARAVAQALERLGVPASHLHQVDGSGLSRDDRVTARAITALLERVCALEPETARLYRRSLAVMGEKGTLEGRLGGTPAAGRVFAKTGWIAGVSSLSGYAESEGGRTAVFSILIEYPSQLAGLNTSCFKKLQDELVLLLVQDGA